MISALQWIPKGSCKQNPKRFVPSDAEMAMMRQLGSEEVVQIDEEEDNDGEVEQPVVSSDKSSDNEEMVDGLPASFQMDQYDEEEDAEMVGGDDDDQEEMMMSLETDNESFEMHDEIDSEDEEDLMIRDTDGIIVVANTEEEFSSLEVHVYDEQDGNLYVHHEIALPALPLSLAWMNLRPETPSADPTGFGSFLAVGTFKPGIEIWDMDVLDALEPTAVLGGDVDPSLRNVALPGPKQTLKENSHSDAVMCLGWNSSHRQMLLSGSADTTVKLWDISTLGCMQTYRHHQDKVQCLAWNPVEATILASASFDKTLVVLDGRNPDALSKTILQNEPESLVWNPHRPEMVLVSQEDGTVSGYDVRMLSKSLFSLQAHDECVSAISCSTQISGLFATASSDKTVKVWDLNGSSPTCVASKAMQVGELYSLSFYDDSPYTLAVGGSDGVLALWDTSENAGVERKFAARDAQQQLAQAAASDIGATLKTPEEHAQQLLAETSLSDDPKEPGQQVKSSTKSKKKKSKKKKMSSSN